MWPGPHPEASEAPGRHRPASPAAAVASAGGTVLESYPAFLVATGTGASRDLLRQAGFQMDDVPDSGFVRLAGGDVRAADLRATGRPWSTDGDGRATAIVHFHAPVKEAWREDLAD